MKSLLDKLNIDETFTTKLKKPIFDNVKANTYPKEDYNFMSDLLFLPTTKKGFRYLLVMTDLYNNDFDIEPLKTKDPKEVLQAMKTMFKRKYIKKPYASIRTDAGTEFMGVFHKYLYDESILHRIAIPNRHQQLANEKLKPTIGKVIQWLSQ